MGDAVRTAHRGKRCPHDERAHTRRAHRRRCHRHRPGPPGGPAVPLPREHRILTKPLSDGSVAVALLNPGDQPLTLATSAPEAGLAQARSYTMHDIWAATTTVTDGRIVAPDIPAHGVVLLRITAGA
ncbi:hypothetical protein [Nocardia kruczakiae]|uniref:hypothetical protein n=1 Tax=Nocardia kruczakiae TaxID=261477 RepID=UPI00350E37AA